MISRQLDDTFTRKPIRFAKQWNAPGRYRVGILSGIPEKDFLNDRISEIHKMCRNSRESLEKIGRGEWIRTTDLLVPNQAL